VTATRRRAERTPPPDTATCGTCRTTFPTVEAFDGHLTGGDAGRRCTRPAALFAT
jgi:hypothetical protein